MKKKKPERVVLAVGYPWFLMHGSDLRMFPHKIGTVPRENNAPVLIDPKGLGNWNKIRLIAEVIK